MEVKYCPKCLSKYVADETGVCTNCSGKYKRPKPVAKEEPKETPRKEAKKDSGK